MATKHSQFSLWRLHRTDLPTFPEVSKGGQKTYLGWWNLSKSDTCHFWVEALRATERLIPLSLPERLAKLQMVAASPAWSIAWQSSAPQWTCASGKEGEEPCLTLLRIRAVTVPWPSTSQLAQRRCNHGDSRRGNSVNSCPLPKRHTVTYFFFGSLPLSSSSAHIWWVPAMAIHRMSSLWISEPL